MERKEREEGKMKRGKGLLVQGTRCTPGVYNWFFEILDYLPRVAGKFFAGNLLLSSWIPKRKLWYWRLNSCKVRVALLIFIIGF